MTYLSKIEFTCSRLFNEDEIRRQDEEGEELKGGFEEIHSEKSDKNFLLEIYENLKKKFDFDFYT